MLWNLARWLRQHRSSFSRKNLQKVKKPLFRNYRPEFEVLENRFLLTAVRFSSANYFVSEAGEWASVTAETDNPYGSCYVEYATGGGSAQESVDYTGVSDNKNVSYSGSTITVEIFDNEYDNSSKTFYIGFTYTGDCTLGTPSTAMVTILDDDHATKVHFTDSNFRVNEDTGDATVAVALDQASANTVTVNYATSDGTLTAGTDYDAASGTLTFQPGESTHTFTVATINDTADERSEAINVSLSSPSNASIDGPSPGNIIFPWFPTGAYPSTDMEQGTVVPFGAAEVAVQTGGLRVEHAIDTRLRLPSGNDGWSSELSVVPGSTTSGGSTSNRIGQPPAGTSPGQTQPGSFQRAGDGLGPALVYLSDSISVQPIIELRWDSGTSGTIPTQFELQLTWDNGTPQSWVTFSVDSHTQEDVYLLAVQVSSPVSESGLYPWQVEMRTTFSNRDMVTRTIAGTAAVIVQEAASPFGYGWSLAGLDRLIVMDDGHALWIYGAGGGRLFTATSGYTYQAPNDMGTLSWDGLANAFRYQGRDGLTWTFDADGRLTTVEDAHGLTRTFTYSSGRLATWIEPGNEVTTLTYDSNDLLETITEPGNRLVTLVHDENGDLTTLINPDGGRRTFTYDDAHRMVRDEFGPLQTTMVYDSTSGRLSSIDRGLGSTLAINPQIPQGLETDPARRIAQGVAVLTDALSQATTFSLDQLGRVTWLETPDGVVQQWVRNAGGQPLSYSRSDQTTGFTYDGLDLIGVTHADSSTRSNSLWTGGDPDLNFHRVETTTDSFGRVTTFTYDPDTGDLLTKRNPLNQVTTYTWSDSLLQTVTDPLGHRTTYVYDASRRLQVTIDPLGDRTTLTYDSAGNTATFTDALGRVTSFTYDSMRRLLTRTDPTGGVASWTYNALGQVTSQTDPLGRVSEYTYDQRAWQTAIREAVGTAEERTTTMVYDALGRVTSRIDPLDHATTMTYDAVGRLETQTSPVGGVTTFIYDAAGNLYVRTDPLGHSTWFNYDERYRRIATITDHTSATVYDTESNVVATIDALGRRTTYTYDALNRLATQTDALGDVTTFVYDAAGNKTAVVDARGNRVTFTYDALNRLVAVTDPLNHTVTTVYDAVSNVVQHIDAVGNVTTMTYDALDRRIAVQDAGGGIATTVYDAVGNVINFTDQLGHKTTYVYDHLNRRTQGIDVLGGVTTTVYDKVGNVVNLIDPVGNQTTFVYDAADRLIEQTDPLGNITTTMYDSDSNVVATIDARGNRTTYTYDALNRLETRTDALENVTTFVYDAVGNRITAIDARGNRTTFTYDAVRRLVAVTDPLNHTVYTVYDAVGNAVQQIDAGGGVTTITYDTLNRLIARQDPAGGTATTVYDAVGNVVNIIDPLAHKTTYTYDNLNRRTQVIDALGGVTTTGYDAVGDVVNVIDSVGNKTTFVYDTAGRLIQQIDPLGNSTTFAYDLAHRKTSQTDRLGRRRDFSYDAVNRQTGETWVATGQTVDRLTYTYDAVGNLLTAANGSGRYTFTYDNGNRLVTVQEPFDTQMTFTYDAVGNRTQVEDSFGGVTTSVYDAANRLTSRRFGGTDQTPLRLDITYTAADQMATMLRYSDLAGTSKVGESDYTYEGSRQLTNLQHKDGDDELIANYTYTYDAAHRVLTETLNGTTTTYSYDSTNQLTNDSATTYTYDANGNRTMSGYQNGSGNRLTNDGTWTYTYDAEGNLTKKSQGTSAETWTYGYDHRDQMIWAEKRATDGGTLQMRADYKYDVFGNRIEKDVDADGAGSGGTTTQRFAYEGGNVGGNVWADIDGSNQLVTRRLYLDGVDTLFARISSTGTAAWYLLDRLGSVRDMTDASGVVQDHISYDGFGKVTSETNPSFGDRYKWTERESDSETGLQYNRARYYDAAIGTWTSEDPIGFAAEDGNLYRYVHNGPTLDRDPTGLFETDFDVLCLHMEGDESPYCLDTTPDPDAAPNPGRAPNPGPATAGEYIQDAVVNFSLGFIELPAMFLDAGQALGALAYMEVTGNPYVPQYVSQTARTVDTLTASGDQQALHDFTVQTVSGLTSLGTIPLGQGIAAAIEGNLAPLEQMAGGAVFLGMVDGALGPPGGGNVAPQANGSPPASTPVGRSGNPLGSVQPNRPTTIEGRPFSGHAIDQMQGRGIPPSVVENTIQYGQPFPGNRPGTTGFYDPVNNVRVITNSTTGNVITVIPGPP